MLGQAHLGVERDDNDDDDFRAGTKSLAKAFFNGCRDGARRLGRERRRGRRRRPGAQRRSGGGGGGGGCCGGGGGGGGGRRSNVYDPEMELEIEAPPVIEALLAFEHLVLAFMMKNDVDNATLTRRVEPACRWRICQSGGEEEGGEGEGSPPPSARCRLRCWRAEKDGRVHELYSQCMKLYERRRREAGEAEVSCGCGKDELTAAIEGERE